MDQESNLGPYTVLQAAAITKLSPAMIDYLCRTRVLLPAASKPRGRGRGRARVYNFADLVMLRTIKGLLDRGISVARLKRSIMHLRKRYSEITPTYVPERFLVTDGQRAFFRNESDVLEDPHTGQLAFSFVVDLKSMQGEVVRLIGDSLRSNAHRVGVDQKNAG